MPELVDTHAHLGDKRFDDDLDEVISRAGEAGVTRIVTVGTDLGSSGRAVEIASLHEGVFAAAGIHPHDAKSAPAEWRPELARLVSRRKVVALGEIGLDFYYMHSPAEDQERLFAWQIELAGELGLPVIVHSRDAEERTMAILEEAAWNSDGRVRGVMHCFSGSAATMRRAVAIRMHVSFAGSVTFKKAGALREVAAAVPADRLLVETDSPYMSPEPKRGGRNEPARVVDVARCVAGTRGVSLEELAEATTANARELFGLG